MNIKEIAQLAGVSTSTVSKIVNHKDDSIAEATRERVLQLVKQYHYRPYASVSAQPGRSWRIGVLLRDSVATDTTIDGIVQTAQSHGYGTLVFNSFQDRERERANIAAALSQRVDGLIWEPVDSGSLLPGKGRPEIHIPELTIGPLGDDEFTMLPYEQASYSLTQELIERGHKHLVCLLTPGRRAESFLNGFKRCLFEHNMEFSEDMVIHEPSDSLMERISSRQVTGVVSSHYKHALELFQYASSLHYRVPEDFSILTVRNDTSEVLHYPGSSEISSYTMRNADFGAYLCTRMVNAIEGGRKEAPGFTQTFHLSSERTLAGPAELTQRSIVVVGSINTDTYLGVPTLPKAGNVVDSHDPFSVPGGKGANQAVGVAKLGQPVSLIANVGSDSQADQIYRYLAESGVDTDGIRRKPGSDTGKVYIFVDNRGRTMSSRSAGANALMSVEDVRAAEHLFERASYCLAQTVVPFPALEEACRLAHRHGAKTIIKPFHTAELPSSLLHECDLLVPGSAELERLCPGPGSRADKAHALINHGAGMVLVTTGQDGCTLYTADGEQDFPTTPVKAAADTGASDAFISALAAYLLYGRPLDQAIRIANKAAGLSLGHEGIIPSLPERGVLEHSLEFQ
ncbi:putative ribokinase [Bifidobacterium actinocoloniiforme DSM 22766]|uniref:Ribokinase n=1 Tax=Bifidobacterium actinocoloniiforme DSM 22766 TaxID=1437605 RepID=A0A086YYC1_9BIFI|nr:PfkB family carbohydrate kinase [Bifidobacterium actinocoloniiforme]AKV55836.1 ribokinase [Bifidobacterium actinocoloniiforme DSM 22766]KFI39271.1 putative ribokinase [Bifidobacterium actinocoloniiforme DSM 22766]